MYTYETDALILTTPYLFDDNMTVAIVPQLTTPFPEKMKDHVYPCRVNVCRRDELPADDPLREVWPEDEEYVWKYVEVSFEEIWKSHEHIIKEMRNDDE